MSSKRAQPASECQACGGTGYVAGAQPIKTGPYVLEPRPARYAEARVARLDRKSELDRLPPTQFLPCGTSLARRCARRASDS
jgi:hypothetical protein